MAAELARGVRRRARRETRLRARAGPGARDTAHLERSYARACSRRRARARRKIQSVGGYAGANRRRG